MVNPIKAQIRSAISKAINGKTSSSSGEINTDQARASLDTSSETNMINSATKNLADQAAGNRIILSFSLTEQVSWG